nr:hypothetical protein [Tanacetum cinerariifolium]
MANPLLNHVINLLDDEQVQPETTPTLLRITLVVLDIPNNNNWWIKEDPEEDLEMEEGEEEEMEIEDEMNDLEIINPYEIDEMDRYLGGIGIERRSETREHYELKQSVSTLEGQMRRLMLEDKEEKERLKKKLKVSQQEKEQMEQAFRHVVDWIHKHFGVEIPPCMDDGDVTIPNNAHPYELRGSPRDTLIMPPKAISQAAIERVITRRVNAALEAERASQVNAGGKEAMQMLLEGKIGHLQAGPNVVEFPSGHIRTRGCEWEILRGLTSWFSYVLKQFQMRKKKVEAYIQGLPENIKGEVTSSRPTNPNKIVCMAHTLMKQKTQAKQKGLPKETRGNGKTLKAEIETTTTWATTRTTPATINTITRDKEMHEQ